MRAKGTAAIGAAAVVTGVLGLVTLAAPTDRVSGEPGDKWFVCKYVITPGEGERLQTGQNPISVSESAIPISPVFIGAEFTDQQGRSLVIAQDVGQPEPGVEVCPPPSGGTTTTTSTTTSSTTTSTSSSTSTSSTTTTESPTSTSTTTTTEPPTTTSSTTTTSPDTSTTSSTTPTATTTSTTPSVTSSPGETTTTEPSLVVDFIEPICDGDVPYLGYSASFPGGTSATITFVNPDGDDVVYSGLPLSGRVLWPGAVVDADGNPLDWPGWTEVAPDVWVEGDEFDWVRPSVTVILEVNPSVTAEIGYPPATPACSANPPIPPGETSTTAPPAGPTTTLAPTPPGPAAPLPPTR